MFTQSKLEQNREILSNFLKIRSIPQVYRVIKIPGKQMLYGYIYCIENKLTGKKYIGSVYSIWSGINKPNPDASLRKRASNYIYEYNHAVGNKTIAKKVYRPIIQALANEGIENFIMYPIAETTRDNHEDAEKYFINLFNTIENGYNVKNMGGASNKTGISRKLLAHEKQLRSEGIIAIHMNNKQIICSDSMKLFGDYINSSKDMIKNSVRKGRPYKGWFIFYIDENKRQYILEKNVLGDGLPAGDRHSEKNKSFYKELYKAVTLYLRDYMKTEYFSDFEMLSPLEYKE